MLKKKTKTGKHKTLLMIMAMTAILLYSFTSFAEEVKWLVEPGFNAEELAKVRAWEKTWAGKRIDRTNIDQIKEFVPQPIYDVIVEKEKWGDFDFWFKVVPYKTYEPTPGQIKATAKYSPTSKFASEAYDALLVNYEDIAGVPFPKPKTGQEIAWNFNSWSRGDTVYKKGGGFTVNAKSTMERYTGQFYWRTFYANRVDLGPLPKLPPKKNPRGIRRANVMRMTAPTSMTDFATFYVKYIDMNKEDDSWLYWPRFRKIIRLQSDQRDDTVDGTDLINDDETGYDGRMNKNKYKLLGRKQLLMCRRADPEGYERKEGMVMMGGLQKEMSNVYVVEVVTQTPGYVYSKQIWYVDPETWVLNYKECYDGQGRLWKFFESYQNMIKSHASDKGFVPIQNGSTFIDLIRRHGTPGSETMFKVGTHIPLNTYSLRSLERKGY